MELHHRSCVVPSNAPGLPDPDSISRRALKERSGNRRHEYHDGSSWKREPSPAENTYPHGQGGSYFTGNLTSQLSGEKSEAQIEYETKRLLGLLDRCEKYQKYRDRQPQNAKEREQKWSDTLERAFFRGLVRWPPMGRRKHMLDGQLRGRNELVADSIMRDTGESRTRKQVSSHIQVLKNILVNQPQLLMHMSTQDLSGRKNRHASSHLNHLRNRHHPYAHGSKYDFSSQPGLNLWQGIGTLPSTNALAKIQSALGNGSDAPYTVINFTMYVHDENKEPIHHYAQLGTIPRLGDLHVTDTTSWHKQYPELNYHRTDELKGRQVLVCDSSIKIMTEIPHKSDKLAIDFVLKNNDDLSIFEPLQSRTRFYDSGVLVDQYDEQKPEYEAETRRIFVPFGSKFWAERLYSLGKNLRDARMSEEAAPRSRAETSVRRSLQYMTAVQDIYSVKRDTREQHCFLTVLWRFNQTKTSNEPGKMMWRVVNFARPAQQRWTKPGGMEGSRASMVNMTSAPPPTLYPSMALDFHHQPYAQHPPPLDLESLSVITIDGMNDFSNPNSATAPSMTTDYSHAQSLPSLSHSQEAISQSQHYHDANEFDFNGGHINIAGCLEPAINLGAYENYSTHASSLTPLNPIAGLEHVHNENPFGDLGMSMGGAMNCYSTKPSWTYTDLISRLEGVAEQTHGVGVMDQSAHGAQDIAGHGVLHDGQLDNGLWKLQQSAFPEDTGVGAHHYRGGMGKEKQGEHGLGILDLIEKDQRRDSLRGY
ncbi:hypothetical protein K505DRAFT_266604 [Melanomma pulvis-pyrius CBS 109.77]|uniref:TEA domain-containing protein n=1 Tax=Melanomma pulvis-pyrius CBS 109.77 TaxID=1314802 RepID=A0A6A6XTP8_9PLEO|nr:hypothetical protein K505DRAFT_266604 [Melanomma pulvis-pyrius CBS 109.77]